MTTYANGLIPAAALKDISTPGDLVAEATASFERLRNAAKADGFNMGTSGTDQAYRPLARQVAILHAYYDHTPRAGLTVANGGVKHYGGQTWYRKPGYATAAAPGTSNHGLGVAVDFQGLGGFTGRGYAWMAKHAGEYGWSNTEGRSIGEAWHWVYDASKDRHRVTKRKPHRISTIAAGDTSWRTRLWQQFLVEQGHKIAVDQDFGRATFGATKEWQKKAGLTADGVVGPKTWFRACYGVKPGAKGYRVRIAQRVLGLTGTAVDGVAGTTYTTRAKQLQHWLGVTADADLGSKTITALITKG